MAEYNIEINKKTSSGFDQLYPKNKATISLYDNSNSGLSATTVQDAIDEIKSGIFNTTATITTTWSGSATPYTQDITINGMLESDAPIVDLIETTQSDDLESDWSNIYRITSGLNKITIYAKEQTTTSIPIQVKVVR